MTKKIFLYPHFYRDSDRDLKQKEQIILKDVKQAEEELTRLKKRAEEVRKEINYRTLPEAQQMKRDITKLEKMLENHESGKTVLSVTKLKKVVAALEKTKEAFKTLLLYGGYLHGGDQCAGR